MITLLAVVGLSPQVVTETLYALHQEGIPVNRIVLITTKIGRERVQATLLNGILKRYVTEYEISHPVTLDKSDIHVIKREDGSLCEDIITESDYYSLMKTCIELAYSETSRAENELIAFSIAGGRKTMSVCLSTAAQLYARQQDILCHVIVPAEFESNPDFFYPPAREQVIPITDAHQEPALKSTRFAVIQLCQMPIVAVRKLFNSSELKEPGEVTSIIAAAKSDILTVDVRNRSLTYCGSEVRLAPAQFALYLFFLRQSKFITLEEVFTKTNEIAALYARNETNSSTGILNLNSENFNSYKSKVNNRLKFIFGSKTASLLEISSRGVKPNTEYGIKLAREFVKEQQCCQT